MNLGNSPLCDLGAFVTASAAALVLVIKAFQMSKCSRLSLCCDAVVCNRNAGSNTKNANASPREESLSMSEKSV